MQEAFLSRREQSVDCSCHCACAPCPASAVGRFPSEDWSVGTLFLGAVVIVPSLIELSSTVKLGGLGSTSLLILVGVAIETAKQVKTYVVSQRYEGMVRQ